jgi:hypothetical protein
MMTKVLIGIGSALPAGRSSLSTLAYPEKLHGRSVPSLVWQLSHGLPLGIAARFGRADYHHRIVRHAPHNANRSEEAGDCYYPNSHR